jgi:hypothetical protein
MTITNPGNTQVALEHDAAETAHRLLSTVSLGAVAPESFPGKLRSRDRLTGLTQRAFERAPAEAVSITDAARADIDALRRNELQADPFSTACLGGASRSIQRLPEPLSASDVQDLIKRAIDPSLAEACQEADRDAGRKFKTRKGVERRRRRFKAEIDTFVQKLQPTLAAHVAGHVQDRLAGDLERRFEACDLTQDALRRFCAQAVPPGEDIPGAHRFSCGPRVEVVLKAAAVNRPDLLDSDGRPTEAIWPAFGAEVAEGDLSVMEDPEEAIGALQGFLRSTIADALTGVTLDGLYAMAHEQPEVPNWIGKASARLHVGAKAPEPYRVRLAQVPAASSDVLYDQVLHHIQTAARSAEPNRLQLMEFTFAYRAQEVLEADPRGLARILAEIVAHASNPQLAEALEAWVVPPSSSGTVDPAADPVPHASVPGLRPDQGRSPRDPAAAA